MSPLCEIRVCLPPQGLDMPWTLASYREHVVGTRPGRRC